MGQRRRMTPSCQSEARGHVRPHKGARRCRFPGLSRASTLRTPRRRSRSPCTRRSRRHRTEAAATPKGSRGRSSPLLLGTHWTCPSLPLFGWIKPPTVCLPCFVSKPAFAVTIIHDSCHHIVALRQTPSGLAWFSQFVLGVQYRKRFFTEDRRISIGNLKSRPYEYRYSYS